MEKFIEGYLVAYEPELSELRAALQTEQAGVNEELLKALRDITFQYIKRGYIPEVTIINNMMNIAQEAISNAEKQTKENV
jgi:hypothetical protein